MGVQDLVSLERNLEAKLQCSGLCRPLVGGALFTVRSLDTAHRELPTCWQPLGISVTASGRALTPWLGFIAAPAIFFVSLCVMWLLAVLPGCGVPPHGGYRGVPARELEVTMFIAGCPAAE